MHLQNLWEGRCFVNHRGAPARGTPRFSRPLPALPEKKRPAPEGAGLPGVVPFDIVNWEGNYIWDTNTFLIVIPYP
jgi:hypothetical protein